MGVPVNYSRMVFAALGATVAYFLLGGLLFTSSILKSEFQKYPAVYRTQEDMKSVWLVGIVGMLLSMFALAALYALLYRGGPGLVEGLRFGALIAVFATGSFVLHNYVNLNIGLRLTVSQAVAYSFEWVVVGVVIGLIYRAPGH
jgi:hypothetical protein